MLKRLIVCSSILAALMPASAALADNVELSPAERAANQKAYARQKALGLADQPRGRGAKKAQKQPEQAGVQGCEEAARKAQTTATGATVLSSVIGLVPFGGSASGFAGAAAGIGASAAGEMARQKSAASMQEDCR